MLGVRLKNRLKTELRRYQRAGVRHLVRAGGRHILGDVPGLGKTIQALAWLAITRGAMPCLIVCPCNALYVWQRQIDEHTHLARHVDILRGRTPREITGKIAIINYDLLPYWRDTLLAWQPNTLIMDESQNVKNMKIARTKTCIALAKVAAHVIPISGTPIINRPIEFFPVLHMVDAVRWPSVFKFAFRYCDAKPGWGGRGWDFSGACRLQELREQTAPYITRRQKEDVLKELPPKNRFEIFVDIENQKEYTRARDNFLNWLETRKGKLAKIKALRAQAIVKIGVLKRIAAMGKLKTAIEWIDQYLDTGKKLVVFCHHKEVLAVLKNRYKDALCGDDKKARPQLEKLFNEDERYKLFLGTVLANNTALTLTGADTTLFIEIGWTPGEHIQAEDRVHRIGQKSDCVSAYYLLGKNTIDEKNWQLLQSKWHIIAKVLDGKTKKEKLAKPLSLETLIAGI